MLIINTLHLIFKLVKRHTFHLINIQMCFNSRELLINVKKKTYVRNDLLNIPIIYFRIKNFKWKLGFNLVVNNVIIILFLKIAFYVINLIFYD